MNIVLVNAYGTSNRGDAALLLECIHDLRAAYPDAKLTVALYEGRLPVGARGCATSERVGNSKGKGLLGRLCSLWFLTVAYLSLRLWSPLIAQWCLPAQQAATVEAIRSADLLVSAPGGYIHDTNQAYLIALFHIWAGLGRCRVLLAPQSIGPLKSPFARTIATKILRRVDGICARESYTLDYLIDTLRIPESVVFRTGDSAFWSNRTPVRSNWAELRGEFSAMGVETSKGIFGITVVDWTYPGLQDPAALRGLYIAAVARIIDDVVAATGLVPVIFNQVADDVPLAMEISRRTAVSTIVDVQDRTAEHLRELIGQSRIFLGTRFHSCIFAMMQGCPTFAIAYLPKTSYIMEDLGMTSRHMPIEALVPTLIVDSLLKFHVDNEAEKARVKELVTEYKLRNLSFESILTG